MPPVAVTAPKVSAMRIAWNGDDSSRRRSSFHSGDGEHFEGTAKVENLNFFVDNDADA
jgi:hypothetical protein